MPGFYWLALHIRQLFLALIRENALSVFLPHSKGLNLILLRSVPFPKYAATCIEAFRKPEMTHYFKVPGLACTTRTSAPRHQLRGTVILLGALKMF